MPLIVNSDSLLSTPLTVVSSDSNGNLDALPNGTTGYILTSTGTSSLPTWQAPSGALTPTPTQTIISTGTGTYIPNSPIRSYQIICAGGGGGGGGCAGHIASQDAGGGGGSAGGTVSRFFDVATFPSVNFSIGAGGAGGTHIGGSGGADGNDTNIHNPIGGGLLIGAFKGRGGIGGSTGQPGYCQGGRAQDPGGTGGDVYNGNCGSPGLGLYLGLTKLIDNIGGNGGSSSFAGGGYGQPVTSNGFNGTKGSGGGGGADGGSGGNGGDGYILINEYY